ncbi:hypothetical protein CLHOM_12440 [Clostridium homopropionicum DSM 5847]|uniref:Uncharacterized protein n=1 Tax=Clostridium homopropionicum DSM 5847 TaxID=1121318 RepID=A0A0L6ZBJ8_9CLOT|nr:hypothetical protein [Clostridium homopropionicum]KOA20332.1 hypothetical protein CLHOM_12440 [Clostridium homopropionicum DSM 5847]SFG93910.1 hypothetical protein SAMN04488501_12517 [Clostridium homopropionicum]
MKSRKILIPIGAFILCILSIYSYTHFNSKSYNVLLNKDIVVKTADELPKLAFGEWMNHFESEAEIVKAADLIILANVKDSYPEYLKNITNPELQDNMIVTMSVIKINKIFKGNIDKNQEIKILRTGGQIGTFITHPIEDTPELNKNQSYLFFLEKTSKGHYLILGGYQGIGKINDNKLTFDKNLKRIYLKLDNKDLSQINENVSSILNNIN